MQKTLTILSALAVLGAGAPVLAQDAEAIARGEAAFSQCQSCHVVRNDAGEVLAGRNGRTGPNLFGVIGRTAGTYPDFRYGDGIVAAGEGGLVWDEASFVAYVQDPTSFLRETTGNNRARGNMSFRVRNEDQARDLYAFLATFSPAPAEGEAPASGN
jgi:cytochrome c